ncbi:MAG: NAD-dependent epimerase/dehydratase family protein [Anaerolineae bacterium]
MSPARPASSAARRPHPDCRRHTARALHRPSSKLDALAGAGIRRRARRRDRRLDALPRCDGCDWVFHVAAVADYWRADHAWMREVNVEGRRVLQAARETGVRRGGVHQQRGGGRLPAGSPRRRADAFNLPPERFPYGYTKALAEIVALDAASAGQEVVIVNPVVVMGPGDLNIISGDFVLKIKRLQWTVPVPPGGVAVVDVRDVARMQLAAAERGRVGERYILGTANYAYRDWFALVADVVGAAHPMIPRRAGARQPVRRAARRRAAAAGRRRPDAAGRAQPVFQFQQGVARTVRAADRHAPEPSGHLHLVSRTRLRQARRAGAAD